MKKEIFKNSVLALLLGFAFLVNAQSVSLSSPMLFSAPFGLAENNSASAASFTLVESSSAPVAATALGLPNVTISVKLQYVSLTNADVDQITGSVLDHFDVSYDSATNILLFKQNSTIPGDWFGSVSFPITVIENSDATESLNGFNANITAFEPTTNADGDVAIYTHTSPNAPAANLPEEFTNIEVFPIPTDKLLHLDNVKSGKLSVAVYDTKGSIILEERLENENNTLDVSKFSRGAYYLRIYESTTGLYRNVKIILN